MINFFFEMGMMQRNRHEGARLSGVDDPESLADHTMRAAIIAYALALSENANPHRCTTMVMIHDIPECRIGDQHKVAARYFDNSDGERKAFEDQIAQLPQAMQDDWRQMFEEFNARSSQDAIVAKDADWLELAISAREYIVRGFVGMQDWLFNISQAVRTPTAQQWMEEIQSADPNAWWKGLKNISK